MKEAEKLRIETDKLEKEITASIENFIKEVGICDVSIEPGISYITNMMGKKKLVGIDTKVYVTV